MTDLVTGWAIGLIVHTVLPTEPYLQRPQILEHNFLDIAGINKDIPYDSCMIQTRLRVPIRRFI